MAETKSVNITKLDSSQLAVQGSHNTVRRLFADTVETAGALALNDTVRMLRLPTDAMVASLRAAFDDLGTTGAFKIGIAYPTYFTPAGGTAGQMIDDDAFASGIDVATAAVAMTDYRFSLRDINSVQKKLWELASLAARPICPELDIVLTASTATTAAGTISMVADAAVIG